MVVPGPIDENIRIGTTIALAVMYGIAAGVSLVQFIRIMRTTKENSRMTSQTILHVFVFLTLFGA